MAKKPITTSKHVTVFNAQITASNLRIKSSLSTLSATERGREVLSAFRLFCESSGASGLDMSGQSALLALFREFTFGGRRDFLEEIPQVAEVELRKALANIANLSTEFGDSADDVLKTAKTLALEALRKTAL